MDVLEALKWRYAVKKFDPTKKLTKGQIDRLVESLCLTATSMGLQLMEFIVISQDELKAVIRPHAYNQSQITDCSHLFVLCRKEKVTEADIQEIIDITSDKRLLKNDSPQLLGYAQMLRSTLTMDESHQVKWMENQLYIALGNLMTVCAVEQIDACPMEGFVREEVDKVLQLKEKGLKTVLMCALGFRSEDDKYNGWAKIRRSKEKLVSYID